MTNPEWVEAGAHDSLCPTQTWELVGMASEDACQCVLIGQVRADEAEYPSQSTIRRVADRAFRDGNAHAEAVAARLVEVICEQETDADRRVDRIILRGALMMADLRAEVEALRKQEWAAPLRAQIAADIEALNQKVMGPPERRAVWHVAVTEAARIARGEKGASDG